MLTLTITVPTLRELWTTARARVALARHERRMLTLVARGAVRLPASLEAARGAQPAPPPPAPPAMFNLGAFLGAMAPALGGLSTLWDDIKHDSLHSIAQDPQKLARVVGEVVGVAVVGLHAAGNLKTTPAPTTGGPVTPSQVLGGT